MKFIVTQICGGIGGETLYTQEVQVLVPVRMYLQIYVLWDRWEY